MKYFIPYMSGYLTAKRIKFSITVVEQCDPKKGKAKGFNRGKLINIGFIFAKPRFFVAHDVDMLPYSVDYDYENIVTGVFQLAKSEIQKSGYTGGVTMFSADAFKKIGGYNNDFFHRAEDNELRFNIDRLKVHISERIGEFQIMDHPRSGAEFIPELWEKAKKPRVVQDQLSCCEFKVVGIDYGTHHSHIKVEL